MKSKNSKKLYFARRLSKFYSSALLIIAVLVISGQILIQKNINNQKNDSEIINVAGKQRMLSQRISRLVMELRQTKNTSEKENIFDELQIGYLEWVEAEENLSKNFIKVKDKNFQKKLKKQKLKYRGLEHRIHSLIEQQKKIDTLKITKKESQIINKKADEFLRSMNEVVFKYEDISEKKLQRLSVIEYTLLFITLIVLILEGLFLFRPITRFINSSFLKLISLNFRYRKEREKAVQLLNTTNQLINEIGTELKKPLNSITGNTDILLKSKLDKEQTSQIIGISRSAEYLSSVINNALLKAQNKTKQITAQNNGFCITKLLHEVVDFLKPKAQQKNLNFIFNCDSKISDNVSGAYSKIKQILITLIDSSIQTINDGHIIFNIKSCLIDELNVHFVFTIEGANLGTTNTETKLQKSDFSIAKEIAESINGSIHYSNNNGNGPKYCFNIILKREVNLKNKVSYQQLKLLRERKILILSNNQELEEHLKHLKVECKLIQKPKQATEELLNDYNYSIAIIDKDISNTSGASIAKQIKETPEISNIKLIMYNSQNQKINLSELKESGFESYLMNPIKSSTLTEVLAGLISEKYLVRT